MVNEVRKDTVLENLDEGNSEKITTSVDKLLEILKAEDKIPMSEAAKKLGVGMEVVQSWVDFLVEEQIVGIEYKFTKPYIYINQSEEAQEKLEEEIASFETIKNEFVKKAEDKDIPKKNIHGLWKNHVKQALENKKVFFMQEASKRGLTNIDKLWGEYQQQLSLI